MPSRRSSQPAAPVASPAASFSRASASSAAVVGSSSATRSQAAARPGRLTERLLRQARQLSPHRRGRAAFAPLFQRARLLLQHVGQLARSPLGAQHPGELAQALGMAGLIVQVGLQDLGRAGALLDQAAQTNNLQPQRQPASRIVAVRQLPQAQRQRLPVPAFPLEQASERFPCVLGPISAVVDATNYVMLELGQPIHAFDLQRLRGPGIVVRRAVDGERLVTLDGVERVFASDDLLICDVERPVAIAGIMGGTAAEVEEATSDVVLESASFSRAGVLRSARRLDLHTEASHRFERGTDPEALDRAAARCATLIAAWTGASVLEGAVTDGEAPPRRWISMRPDRAASLLGYPVSADDAVAVFTQLGFDHRADEGRSVIEVEVPGYRVDIDREVDLIEEIVRVQGYDRVGSRLPRAPQAGGLPEDYAFVLRLKETLRAAGLREIRPAPFVSIDDRSIEGSAVTGDGDAIPIANPLRAEEGYLRRRLTPGLLHAVARNQALGTRSVALFEVGTVFRLIDPGPFEQRRKIAFVLAGPIGERWYEEHRVADALDARGVLEAVLDAATVETWSLGETPGEPFHPGRSAWVTIAGERAGVLGELHPRVASALQIEGRVAVCELEMTALIEGARKEFVFREVPRVPPVRRDLAFVVPTHVPAGELEAALEEAGGALLDEVILFDTYEGPPLPAGAKSLAFAVAFRDPERTLESDEVQPVVDRIAALVSERFGGELRAG